MTHMQTQPDTGSALMAAAAIPPPLDPGFVPAVKWQQAFLARAAGPRGRPVVIQLEREGGYRDAFHTRVLPAADACQADNRRYLERVVKFLLWQRGATRVRIAGAPELAAWLATVYAPDGARAFDYEMFSSRCYREPLRIEAVAPGALPPLREAARPLGRHVRGCRIGFDLGGSDRKCAAVIDGKVVFSDEVAWNPYFEKDPAYHREGIRDSLRRAAAHLPRVDAIGGSAAGIYVNNEIRVGSLYRGVAPDAFDRHVRRLFFDLKAEWNNVPFDVANDGDVTALAASMSLNINAVLGLSLGTSTAAGYVTPQGTITNWLNELAFVPVDFRADAPVDEWSGDAGCGVQYFSQQAVNRLLEPAGIELPADLDLPGRLVAVQNLMRAGDARAARLFETIGVYLGYTLAWLDAFYTLDHVLILGRVTSGGGGSVILEQAARVLKTEFPVLADRLRLHVPDEQFKRHGQAIAAASLPALDHPAAKVEERP